MNKRADNDELSRSKRRKIIFNLIEDRIASDYERVCAAFTEDAVYRFVGDRILCPFAGAFVGRRCIREAMRLLDINFEYIDLDETFCLFDRSHAAVRWKSVWRNRGSGDSMPLESFAHLVFEGDFVREYTLFTDTASVLRLIDSR